MNTAPVPMREVVQLMDWSTTNHVIVGSEGYTSDRDSTSRGDLRSTYEFVTTGPVPAKFPTVYPSPINLLPCGGGGCVPIIAPSPVLTNPPYTAPGVVASPAVPIQAPIVVTVPRVLAAP